MSGCRAVWGTVHPADATNCYDDTVTAIMFPFRAKKNLWKASSSKQVSRFWSA